MKRRRLPTKAEIELARLRQRLRDMVVEVEGPLVAPCWIWQGRVSKGYGQIEWHGGTHGAHRLAYLAWCGPIPDYKIICHICNVAACINPAHLYAGTDATNMDDRARAGGTARGEEIPSSILKEPNVLAIIALLDKGYTVASVAKQFGVSKFTIYDIASGRYWVHLPRPEGLRDYRVGNRRTKITEAQVHKVVRLLKEGHSHRAIAARFGETHGTIRDIAAGRSWRDIPRD